MKKHATGNGIEALQVYGHKRDNKFMTQLKPVLLGL